MFVTFALVLALLTPRLSISDAALELDVSHDQQVGEVLWEGDPGYRMMHNRKST